MKYEFIHDTIARQIFEKASTEARTRRKIEKYISDRHEAHKLRGAHLSQDDIDYIMPYFSSVNISAAEQAFIEKQRQILVKQRNRRRGLIATAIIVLIGFSIVSFSLYQLSQSSLTKMEVAQQKTLEEKLKAEKAELVAKENADKAQRNAKRAEDNAKRAEDNANRAISAEKDAKEKGQEALKKAREATAAKLQVDTALIRMEKLTQEIVASKNEITSVIYKAISAIKLYQEKNDGIDSIDSRKLASLTQEIFDYGDSLSILLPKEYDYYGWGYEDAFGNNVIYPQYQEANAFIDGKATVKLNNTYYKIDKKGNILEAIGGDRQYCDWVPARKHESLPSNAVVGGFELSSRGDTIPLFIGRGVLAERADQGKHSGKIKEEVFSFGWGGKEKFADEFEVLVLNNAAKGRWVEQSELNLYEECGWIRVQGGWNTSSGGEPLFITRASFEDQRIPGKLHMRWCHFPYDGLEKLGENYEFFIVADNSLECPLLPLSN